MKSSFWFWLFIINLLLWSLAFSVGYETARCEDIRALMAHDLIDRKDWVQQCDRWYLHK